MPGSIAEGEPEAARSSAFAKVKSAGRGIKVRCWTCCIKYSLVRVVNLSFETARPTCNEVFNLLMRIVHLITKAH